MTVLTPGLKADLAKLRDARPKLRDEDRRKIDYIIQQAEPRRERPEEDLRFLFGTGLRIIKSYKEVTVA